VQLCGDAHLSNFGAFAAPDRRIVADVNDFDETLAGPFEWDVKRLAASLVVASRDNGFDADESRAVVAGAMEVYRVALALASSKDPLDVWYSRVELDDLAAIATADQRKGLQKRVLEAEAKAKRKDRLRAAKRLTETVDGKRQIRHDPPLITRPTPEELDAELEQLVAFFTEYRDGLSADRRHILDAYAVVDLAHKVVGVGSVGTRCWILLLETGDGDPLFLQFKEATTSVLEPHLAPCPFENSGQRVVEGQRLMQGASDVFLGWARFDDRHGRRTDYYFRQLWDGKLSVDISTLGPKRLRRYARFCGLVLARAHARTGDAAQITGYLGETDEFDQAINELAHTYADRNEADYARMKRAIDDGQLEIVTGL
jgi:uncharacterized protein (DUF2252 family)